MFICEFVAVSVSEGKRVALNVMLDKYIFHSSVHTDNDIVRQEMKTCILKLFLLSLYRHTAKKYARHSFSNRAYSIWVDCLIIFFLKLNDCAQYS